MNLSIPFWSIPAIITTVGFLVIFFWPYEKAGDYSFNLAPILAFFLWVIGSLVCWLIYFMVF